jgi:hypothetical protein
MVLSAYTMVTDAFNLTPEELNNLMEVQTKMLSFVRKTLSLVCSEEEIDKILTASVNLKIKYKRFIQEKYGALLELSALEITPEDQLIIQNTITVTILPNILTGDRR